MVNFFQQTTGQAFSSHWASGVEYGVYCLFYGAECSGWEETMLLASSFVMAAGMLTMGGLGISDHMPTDLKKGVTYVLATELPALRLRDMTLRLGFVVNVAFNFVVNITIPYLVDTEYASLNSKVGFIFGAVSALVFVCTYFFIPECRGKSLEQVDLMFLRVLRC
ncbi:hypothetical protein BBP40_003549 [Aspergillus hancockii]|nr:hypothetical protein BBP40_003549 [Aspergillus hancockii]